MSEWLSVLSVSYLCPFCPHYVLCPQRGDFQDNSVKSQSTAAADDDEEWE